MLNVIVLAGDVSCAWPVSDFLPFYPLEVSGKGFFLAILALSQIILSILYFNFLYILWIKVRIYGVYYEGFSMIGCILQSFCVSKIVQNSLWNQ